MDKVLLALSTLCFLGGFVYAVVAVRTGRHRPSGLKLGVMGLGFALQCGFLYLRGQMHGRCPITSVYEVLVFVSWSAVMLYFLLGQTFRLSLLGMFTSPMVFVFQSVALAALLAGPDEPHPAPGGEVDGWLEFHAAVSLLAYGAFALACVAGVMYLVQDRQLKKHRMKALFYNLPPIHYLAKAIMRLLGIGLLLLTAGIVSAFFMNRAPSAAHLGMSVAVWVVYAALFAADVLHGLGARKVAGAAVGAFALPVVTLLLLSRF